MSLNRKLFSISASDAVCNSESLQPFGNEASFNKNVAIYEFEDNANDSSGNGKNATASGVTYVTGKFGKAASFDGTNDYVELPSNVLPENSTSSSTATCWFKTTYAGTEMGTILNSYNAYAGGTSSTPGWTIFTEGSANFLRLGSYYLDGSNVVGTDGTTNVSDGNWHFIAVVFDISANTLKCYLDGNSSPEISITGLTTSTVDIFTGNATIGYQKNPVGSNRYFNGQIDQVRIYSKALNTEEISTLYLDETDATASSTTIIPGTSCIAYYPLDYDGQDKSTNYDGTPSNVEFVQNGKINYSALFNGSSSKIEVSNALIPNGATSISFWYNANGNTGSTSQYILGQGGATASKGITVYWYNQSFGALVAKGTSSLAGYVNGTLTLSTTSWHHCVVTWDGTASTNALKVYSNGSLNVQGTSDTTSASIGTYTNFAIGGLLGSTWAEGYIDEVRVFNKVLSASEVTTLYGLTACTPTCTTDNDSFPATNVAYYKLDGDATDSHGGTYDGTASNITYASGRFGSAASFNGSNSSIDTGYTPPAGSGDFSVSCWVSLGATGLARGIWATSSNVDVSGNDRRGLGLSVSSSNVLNIRVFDSAGVDSFNGSTLVLNTWYHIVITYDGGLTRMYVNGNLQSGSVNQSIVAHQTSIHIGHYYATHDTANLWSGLIDQFRVYTSVLTGSNVQDLYDKEFQCYITKDASNPFGSGEVAFFKFQNNLTDSTGSYAADASNVAYTTTDPAFGTYSLSFNDTDNYIDFGTSGKIPVVGVSYWVKMNAAGSATRDAIIHSEETSSTYFGCVRWGTSDGATGFYAGGSYWNYSGSDWQFTGKWHHIYQDKDLNVYLNGVQINSGSAGGTSQNIRYIGKYPTGSSDYYMNGYMAQLRVFSTALTGDQVWKLYAERNN